MKNELHDFIHLISFKSDSTKEDEIIKRIKKLQKERFEINKLRHIIIDSIQEHRSNRRDKNELDRLKYKRELICRKINKLERKLRRTNEANTSI
jgi:uncharacterized coiled-coil DUF342 family protein